MSHVRHEPLSTDPGLARVWATSTHSASARHIGLAANRWVRTTVLVGFRIIFSLRLRNDELHCTQKRRKWAELQVWNLATPNTKAVRHFVFSSFLCHPPS